MEGFFDVVNNVITAIDDFVWGVPLMVLILFGGILLTVRLGGLQFRQLPRALRYMVKNEKGCSGEVTSFGALCTALSATIGTGNIVGVATAVVVGGPGAMFWMWLAALFGMATKYVEVYASVRYRVRDHAGNMLGGAMYVWERAFMRKDGTRPWWAKLGGIAFAAFAVVATIGTGSAVQSAAITGIIESSFPGVPDWAIALVIAIAVALVIFGGVKSISSVAEKLVPFMAVAYFGGCMVILAINWQYVGPALAMIFECAFTSKAAFGGAVGSGIMVALQFGCARGLFSNESGLGSAPIVAAAAATKNPARQALVAMTGTFWSTVVICAVTGIVLVAVGIANPGLIENGGIKEGAALASAAFATIPYIGTPILVLGMVSFAYSTILGWSYYGNRCVTYLFGAKAQLPYQVFYVIIGFLGAVGIGDAVWLVSDIGNALMAIPNIIMVLALSGLIARETQHYIYDGNLDEVCEDEIPVIESK